LTWDKTNVNECTMAWKAWNLYVARRFSPKHEGKEVYIFRGEYGQLEFEPPIPYPTVYEHITHDLLED
jgi:hypothetical protein